MIATERYAALACAVVQQAVDNVNRYPAGSVPTKPKNTREGRDETRAIAQAAKDRQWLRDVRVSVAYTQLAGIDHEAMIDALDRRGVMKKAA